MTNVITKGSQTVHEASAQKDKGFSRYLKSIAGVFDFFEKLLLKSLVISGSSIFLSVALLLCMGSVGVLPFIIIAISTPVLIISAIQMFLLKSAKKISELKDETYQAYKNYAGDEPLEINSKKAVLANAYFILRFAAFAVSSKDTALEIKDAFLDVVKLFSPVSLFLFLLTFVVMWIQVVLTLIMMA